jgi:hypothetical protein
MVTGPNLTGIGFVHTKGVPEMQDVLSMLNALRRPRLLMRAARIGAEDYRRTAHLPRLLGYGNLPRHGAALMRLVEIEADLNTQRTAEDASYSLLRHIDVLIAIVGEARILRAAQTVPAA